jgi:hypothetical protein
LFCNDVSKGLFVLTIADDSTYASVICEVPPIACVTPAPVWDAFAWHPSTTLRVRLPKGELSGTRPSAQNPADLHFVFIGPDLGLPKELARLHTPNLANESEYVLAPYAIDDATDVLHAEHAEPKATFEAAVTSAAALFWALHDWSHFHNHGPFIERAWTELQCDQAALYWTLHNRSLFALETAWLRALITEAEARSVERFRDENVEVPAILAKLTRERLAQV